MSVFSKAIESIIKSFGKESSKDSSQNASKQGLKSSTHNATQNASKSANNDIMPNQNPQRHKMQEQHIQDFGKNYPEFKGKGQEAIKHLLQTKSGQVQGAFYRNDLGDITLAWGKEGSAKSDGFGLAKIAKYHPEVLDNLTEIVEKTPITKETPNRYALETEQHFLAIRKEYDGQKEKWLLTAFEKEKKESGSAAKRRTDLPSTQKSEAKKTTLTDTLKGNSTTNQSKNKQNQSKAQEITPFTRE